MKAALLLDYGPVENFRIVDIAPRDPGPKEVMIKVQYAGLRWPDIMVRRGDLGRRHTKPWVPGMEAFGIIEKVGSEVKDFEPGQSVISMIAEGSFAEYLTAPANLINKVPEGVRGDQMLCYAVNMVVAHLLVYGWGKIQPGETILLHTAAGGVGQMVLQLIKRRGTDNKVIALSSRDEKLDLCRAEGADYCINYKKTDYVREILNLFENKRVVDISLNGVGGDTLKKDRQVIRPLGRWILYGVIGGVQPLDVYAHSYDSITIMPFSMIPFIGTEIHRKAVQFMHEWVTTEKLIEPTVYPLEEIGKAQDDMEHGRTSGKIVIKI